MDKLDKGHPLTWVRFRVGDIVTRDGTDRHRVVHVDAIDDGQCIEVVCVRAPESGWCAVGDDEVNMARRYDGPLHVVT